MRHSEASAELQQLLTRAQALATILASPEAPPAAEPTPAPPEVVASPFGDEAGFYDFLRGDRMLGPKISPSEYQGCTALTQAMAAGGWGVAWAAYGLATAYHETAATMQPIKERGGPAYFHRMYDIKGARPKKARELGNLKPGEGALFAGRGYVQLTGRVNYEKAREALGHELVSQPDLAMRPDIAAAIMVRGMQEGWFCPGQKLGRYLRPGELGSLVAFTGCRRIINGTDKDDEIADYALRFQKGLVLGKWRVM